MKLAKGMKIKMTKTNCNEMFKDTCSNSELVYVVERVNAKTYSLKCVDGYMKNTGCTIRKDFAEESKDVYGTITRWEVV